MLQKVRDVGQIKKRPAKRDLPPGRTMFKQIGVKLAICVRVVLVVHPAEDHHGRVWKEKEQTDPAERFVNPFDAGHRRM